MKTLRTGIVVLLAGASLLAMTPFPQDPEFPPDLTILSADDWSFEEEGRVLLLRVEIANAGVSSAGETVVRAFGWGEFEAGVPSLAVEEVARVEIVIPIPADVAGSTQQLEVVVDPDEDILDFDRENNAALTPPIDLPDQAAELFIEGVSPPEAEPGQSLELEIMGGGFQRGAEVIVEGVEVTNVAYAGETLLVAGIFVPEDAEPGPRRVEVNTPDGGQARLEEGFSIVGGEPPAQPTPVPTREPSPPPGPGPGVLIGGVLGLMAATAVLVTFVRLLTRPGKKRLQKQAQKEDPPDQCAPGSRWVKVTEPQVSPGPWEVDVLTITLYDPGSGAIVRGYDASRKVVSGFNKAIDLRRRRPKAQDRFDKALQPVADELAAQIIGWQALDGESRDVTLYVDLEGPEVEAQFESYRCKKRQWVKEREWTGKIQATEERHAGTLYGPRSGEEQAAYAERTRGDVVVRLRELAETVVNM